MLYPTDNLERGMGETEVKHVKSNKIDRQHDDRIGSGQSQTYGLLPKDSELDERGCRGNGPLQAVCRAWASKINRGILENDTER